MVLLSVRVSEDELKAIESKAEAEGTDRSTVLRRLIREGLRVDESRQRDLELSRRIDLLLGVNSRAKPNTKAAPSHSETILR